MEGDQVVAPDTRGPGTVDLGDYAAIQFEGRVRRVIRIGVIRDGVVEVIDGLSVGDLVVTRGQTELIDGSPVQVRSPDGAPAPTGLARRLDEARVR